MSKFRGPEAYLPSEERPYDLLPFRFTHLDAERYVLTNLVGEYVVCDRSTIGDLVSRKLSPDSLAYADFEAKHIIRSGAALELLALKQRSKLAFLASFTSLHIVVVTLRCEHSCPYCQVSRRTSDTTTFDMTKETAERALQLVFRSPAPHIKIEFQGGEPLLNFSLIRFIVERGERINVEKQRDLQFVIATNLALLDDEMLDFCKAHDILISTSLDGPEDLHNKNRPRPGRNSYRRTIEGINAARAALGHERVSAVMTTTLASLPRVREIIDEYLAQGFRSIFLRPLSPYGFAVKTKAFSAYSRDAWLDFWKTGLDHILDLNRTGTPVVESYSAILLKKMLTPWTPPYVDLMTPAGAGISAIVYNYDGDVYASDESRMLAEMGDKSLRIGAVTDPYEDIILSPALLDALEESFSGSAPMCSDCAFEPYCGSEPVYHRATQGDFVGKKPLSDFCARQMAMCRHLIGLLEASPETKRLFYRWAFG